MTLTYSDYLEVDKLLDLQVPRSDPAEHDEMLFIIIHQAYELWFKQMMHEMGKVNRNFSDGDLPGAMDTLGRMRTIMKVLVQQMDILETMTPLSFSSFRDRLDTASGFQSVQFRVFEFALGYKRENMIEYHNEANQTLLREWLDKPTMIDHFYDLLESRGARIPHSLREKSVRESTIPSEELQQEILALYKGDAQFRMLVELMTDFDEGLLEWRYRHVMLVMRTIGQKQGTGGSLGVEFLKKSLFKPVFPDLWAIRHEL